jgi:hypothetical protein
VAKRCATDASGNCSTAQERPKVSQAVRTAVYKGGDSPNPSHGFFPLGGSPTPCRIGENCVHVMTVDGRRRTGSSPTRFFLGPPPTKALTTSSSSPADWITGLSFGGFALTPTSQPDHSCPVGVMLRCIRIRTEARQPCPFLLRRYAWSISTPDSFSDCGSCWRRWITLQFQCIDCAAGGACWTTPKVCQGVYCRLGLTHFAPH